MGAPDSGAGAAVGASRRRDGFLGKGSEFAESRGERDLRILDERMLADEPKTLAELGTEFEVSRERVRQLDAKLVKRLRTYMEENLVDFDYYAPSQA